MIDVGTGPDSWGVWFAHAPGQVRWAQYLDEAARSGYLFTELGPYGYAPREPARVVSDLAAFRLRPLASFAEVDLSDSRPAGHALEVATRTRAYLREIGLG